MYCRKCGAKMPDDSLFCNVCGTKVEENDNGGTSQEINQYEESYKAKCNEQTSFFRKNKKKIIILAICIFVIIMIIKGINDGKKQHERAETLLKEYEDSRGNKDNFKNDREEKSDEKINEKNNDTNNIDPWERSIYEYSYEGGLPENVYEYVKGVYSDGYTEVEFCSPYEIRFTFNRESDEFTKYMDVKLWIITV